jgi:hypothetical protein
MELRDLWALCYLTALQTPVRPVTESLQRVRLDDTGRPPHVPLRPAGGPRA